MGRSKKAVLLVPLLGLASLQALACYTVYDRTERVVYYSEKPPVDMSRPLHETVSARFPGGHMVFDTQQCSNTLVLDAVHGTVATSSPLLTDERTARAMNAPYQRLGRGVVLVQQKDARMPPGLSVLPAGPRARFRSAPEAAPIEQPQPQPQPAPRTY